MYLYVLIGLILGVPVVWRYRDRIGLGIIGAVGLSVLYSACSVAAALAFALIEGFLSGSTGANGGAVSTYGIYFIGSCMMLLVCRFFHLPSSGVMDLYAVFAMPSLFMMRLNCLASGCCIGLPMWDTGYHWPTRESELIFYALMFILMWRMMSKEKYAGQLFPLLMVCYGSFRFVNQWFRDTGSEGLHMAHGWSILCALIGLGLLLTLRKENSDSEKRKGKK